MTSPTVPDRDATPPGALIALDGTLNLRDLGGWTTSSGTDMVTRGRLYRSDRLSDLTAADHALLERLRIATVVDLRYEREVTEHPSRLWSGVENHLSIPMGGELADQRSFIERALDGDFDGITDDDVGESYITFLADHAVDFGTAIAAVTDGAPALFHCTAGKDRTGLLAMLVLRTLAVSDADVLRDFTLSNMYRAERRMAELRPVFAERGPGCGAVPTCAVCTATGARHRDAMDRRKPRFHRCVPRRPVRAGRTGRAAAATAPRARRPLTRRGGYAHRVQGPS